MEESTSLREKVNLLQSILHKMSIERINWKACAKEKLAKERYRFQTIIHQIKSKTEQELSLIHTFYSFALKKQHDRFIESLKSSETVKGTGLNDSFMRLTEENQNLKTQLRQIKKDEVLFLSEITRSIFGLFTHQ
jgi:demethoxyubiquinone hydroxylase (CLK1/Coq7/Cat5 family)